MPEKNVKSQRLIFMSKLFREFCPPIVGWKNDNDRLCSKVSQMVSFSAVGAETISQLTENESTINHFILINEVFKQLIKQQLQ